MPSQGRENDWTLDRLLRRAGVKGVAHSEVGAAHIRRLTVDSRDVRSGDCFIALAGSRVDGHDFVDQALARGAAAALVEESEVASRRSKVGGEATDYRLQAQGKRDACVIEVADTHLAVAQLAAAFYGVDEEIQAGRLRVIGVTGTNGKSTVCMLIRSILAAAGHRPACFGTITNDSPAGAAKSTMTTLPPIELCAALAGAVDAGADTTVLEASSHALDQQRCAGLRFAVGVFTNLTHDHLDYHKSFDEYVGAKKRLFDDLPPSAVAVVNAEDPRAEEITRGTPARVVRYGLRGRDLSVTAEVGEFSLDGTSLRIRIDRSVIPISSSLIGRHNLMNVLAAAATAHGLGVSTDAIREGIESLCVVSGRLERVPTGDSAFSVFVDYAHTPDGLERVLETLRPLTAGRLICVFGCGGDRDRAKRPVMGRIVARRSDLAIITSDNPRNEDPLSIIAEVHAGMNRVARRAIMVEPDRRRAIELATETAAPGDVVLIAGRGHEDEQVIGSRRLPFNDVAVAREALVRLVEAPS